MSMEKERFKRVEKILEAIADMPEDVKHFMFGYMMRVNEECDKKEKTVQVI